MAVEISIEGMTEFTDRLETVQKKLPDLAINTIDKHSRRITREYRKKIKPIRRTGNLSKGMRTMKAQPESGDWVGGVKSYAPHFHLVEYGHRVVPVKGRKKSSGNVVVRGVGKDGGRSSGKTTFVPGRYYLKKTLGMSERLLSRDIEKMLKEGMDVLSQ